MPELPPSLASSSNLLTLDQHGVPPKILSSLPNRYDLRQFISSTFYTLQALTRLPRTDPSTPALSQPQAAPPSSAAAIITIVDSELYHSIGMPEQESRRSRRRYIVQSYQILLLLYSAFLDHFISPPPSGLVQELCSHIESLLLSKSPACGAWGSAVTSLSELLLTGDGVAESLKADIEGVVNNSMVLESDEWKGINHLLLVFFVNSELCRGRLQGLWRRRLRIVDEDNFIYHDH